MTTQSMITQKSVLKLKKQGAAELHPKVSELDFVKLRHKYTQSDEAEMSERDWDKAEREYRRFLSLKCWYPGISLVPSKEIDKLWHAHILDTRAYRDDCQHLFGRFMDHYPYFGLYGDDDYQLLVSSFEDTKALYEKHFSRWPYPDPVDAARCEDHACHVPSTCACRVPGACK